MKREHLQRLFPEGVVVEVAGDADGDEQLLHPAEVALMGAMVPARRREFAAGRNTARRALGLLGFPAIALPRHGADRDVAWPAGSTGSISHTRGLCAVACARVTPGLPSVGLDVEQAGPLGDDIVAEICRTDELAMVGSLAPPAPSDWPRLFFAMKEAAFKAWFPVTRQMLAFHDMRIVVDAPGRTYRAEVLYEPASVLRVTGCFNWDGQYVAAGAVLTRG